MFIAIDVATLGSPEEFKERVQALIDDVKATPLAQDAEEIFFPGELEDRNEARTGQSGGLALPRQTAEDLRRLATDDLRCSPSCSACRWTTKSSC